MRNLDLIEKIKILEDQIFFFKLNWVKSGVKSQEDKSLGVN
jgi:hypothetical protein